MTNNKVVTGRLNLEDYSLLEKLSKEHNINNYQCLKFLLRNYYNLKFTSNYRKTPVILKDTHNGKIQEFESISKLMDDKKINLSRTTLYRKLTKKCTKLIKKRYQIIYKK